MRYEDREAASERGRENWLAAGTASPRRTPRALHLSRIRAAAPEWESAAPARLKAARRAKHCAGARGEREVRAGPRGGRVAAIQLRPHPASSLPRPGVRQHQGAPPRRGARPTDAASIPGWAGRPGTSWEQQGRRGPQALRNACRAAAGRGGEEVARRVATPPGLEGAGLPVRAWGRVVPTHRPRGRSGGAAFLGGLGPQESQVHTRPWKQTSQLRAPGGSKVPAVPTGTSKVRPTWV